MFYLLQHSTHLNDQQYSTNSTLADFLIYARNV